MHENRLVCGRGSRSRDALESCPGRHIRGLDCCTSPRSLVWANERDDSHLLSLIWSFGSNLSSHALPQCHGTSCRSQAQPL